MDRSAIVLIAATLTVACTGSPYGDAPSRPRRDPAPQPAPARASSAPVFVPAPSGDIPTVVTEAASEAQREGGRLLVYVGATWCEPCQAFHAAVERGELDDALAGVRFLEFDADRDGSRLDAAGYGGRLIPRFAVPGDDGRGTGLQIEGGIKGDGAVEHIMQRLDPLLRRTANR